MSIVCRHLYRQPKATVLLARAESRGAFPFCNQLCLADSLERMSGTLLLSREDGQSVTITYTDTGFLPTELSISTMRAELEAAK